jgi:hypothetical protein
MMSCEYNAILQLAAYVRLLPDRVGATYPSINLTPLLRSYLAAIPYLHTLCSTCYDVFEPAGSLCRPSVRTI